jgi:hypothetical protein
MFPRSGSAETSKLTGIGSAGQRPDDTVDAARDAAQRHPQEKPEVVPSSIMLRLMYSLCLRM